MTAKQCDHLCAVTEPQIKHEKYELPVYWACYLLYGEDSGLEESEIEEIESFIESEGLGRCVDVGRDSWFRHRNDATRRGGDVCEFTFELKE